MMKKKIVVKAIVLIKLLLGFACARWIDRNETYSQRLSLIPFSNIKKISIE
jgi:hypothetical protein